MPAVEYPFYRFGGSFPIFRTERCRIGVATCFDNTFPEVPRILALKGAELILMPNAWSEKDPFEPGEPADYEDRRRTVLTYVPSRAYDNGVYVVHLDQVGEASADMRFPGFSVILGPDGQVLAETRGGREEMIVADLNSRIFEDVRSRPDFSLRARRPDIYDELTNT
jgi:N-carbamoylputrescine amidase